MLSCCIVGAQRWSIVDAQRWSIVDAQRWSIVDASLCIDDISASPFGVYFIYLVKQKRTAFDIWTVYVTQVT